MPDTVNWIRVGTIVKAHGIDGEVVVAPYTDFPELRFEPGREIELQSADETDDKTVRVENSRPHQGRWLLKFENIDDRTDAEELRDRILLAEPDEEIENKSDEFLDYQLEGFHVQSADGEKLGTIVNLQYPTQNPVFEIRTPDGNDLDFPVHDDLIESIDPETRTLTLRLPTGWKKMLSE